MKIIAAALLLFFARYDVQPTNGTVEFSIMKWGVFKEEGTFRRFSAHIDYDPRDVARSRVKFEVDVNIIDTKNDNRDGRLRSVDFSVAQRYPKMTFRSTRVVPRGANLADVTGDLTIRGV